jgi:hypothetical protein
MDGFGSVIGISEDNGIMRGARFAISRMQSTSVTVLYVPISASISGGCLKDVWPYTR